MRRTWALGVAVAVSAIGVAVGIWLIDLSDDEPRRPASGQTSPSASAEPQGLSRVSIDLPVRRTGWCDDLDPDAVEQALGGEAVEEEIYGVGDQVPVGRAADISGEFGCIYTSERGAVARTWVFSPPISPQAAAELKVDALGSEGCESVDPLQFGTNAVGLRCTSPNFRLVSFRGLFGDAWLTCSLRANPKRDSGDLLERAEEWCAEVAVSASGS